MYWCVSCQTYFDAPACPACNDAGVFSPALLPTTPADPVKRRLNEIRCRLQERTPGEWQASTLSGYASWVTTDSPFSPAESLTIAENMAHADAVLMAHAPDDLAYLLMLVENDS